MKKLICILMAAVLVLGLCACNNMIPDTTDIFAGVWVLAADEETGAEYLGSNMVIYEDGTAVLNIPGKTYNMTWAAHILPDNLERDSAGKLPPEWQGYATNPDAIDIVSLSGPEGDLAYPDQPNFPVLKVSLTVVEGEMFLQITDGNAKDDEFKITLLLTKAPAGTEATPVAALENVEPATEATEAATEATEAVTETVEATEAATETTTAG